MKIKVTTIFHFNSALFHAGGDGHTSRILYHNIGECVLVNIIYHHVAGICGIAESWLRKAPILKWNRRNP
jgi:hypothetical protein